MGRFVDFRESAYKQALKQSFKNAVETLSRDIYQTAQMNLASMKVRNIEAKYQGQFASALKKTNIKVADGFAERIYFDNAGQNQSFRAIYYEYGTGTSMRPPKGWTPSNDPTWNPMRPKKYGARFYYRDRDWTDLGGNFHKSSVKPGVKKMLPSKSPYSEPIKAQFWFRNAVKAGTKGLDGLVLQAVKSVPITAYIRIRDVRKRM